MKPIASPYTALSNGVDKLRTRHRKLPDRQATSDEFEVMRGQLRRDILRVIGELSTLADGANRFQVLLDQSRTLLVTLDRLAPGTTTPTRSKRPSRSNAGTTTRPSSSAKNQKASKNQKVSQHGAETNKATHQNGKTQKSPNRHVKTTRESPQPTIETPLVTEESLRLSLALTPDPLTVVGIDKATGKKIIRLVDIGPTTPRPTSRRGGRTRAKGTSVWTVSGGLF